VTWRRTRVPADPLWLPADLSTVPALAVALLVASLVAPMETAREEVAAGLTAGDDGLGASDVLDRWILAACAGASGEVWAGRTIRGFMTAVYGLWVAAGGWRTSAGECTRNSGPALNQQDVLSRSDSDLPGDRRINNRFPTMTDQFVVTRLQAAPARAPVILPLTGVQPAAQPLAARERASVQILLTGSDHEVVEIGRTGLLLEAG
jgi:hypothetical protein